jgi:hypothetical protein
VDSNDNQFEIPAIWFPGQSNAEFLEEVTLMLARVNMTHDFLAGKLEVDTFLDFIEAQGYDPFELAENCWNPCLTSI